MVFANGWLRYIILLTKKEKINVLKHKINEIDDEDECDVCGTISMKVKAMHQKWIKSHYQQPIHTYTLLLLLLNTFTKWVNWVK